MSPPTAPLEHHPPARLDPRRVRRAMGRAAPVESDDFLAFVNHRLVERVSEIRLDLPCILELGRVPGHAAWLLRSGLPEARVITQGLAAPRPEAWSAPAATPEPGLPLALVGDPVKLPFAANSFDLVIANMTLHWSADAMRALREIRRVLKPGAPMLLATMGPATLSECRAVLAEIDQERHGRVWPRIPEFFSLADLGDLFGLAGLARPVVDREIIRPRFEDVEHLLFELRRIGATNAHRQRPPGLMGKGFIRELARRCVPPPADPAAGLPVTLEILFGHAWKP
ncbi:MAG: methyltransferase domain-containing protein [Magnetococcales bacterium]|nr:methyltransferase domain-containing protein [Magnetococcales bacterium]